MLGTFRFLISCIKQQTLAGQIKRPPPPSPGLIEENGILDEFPVVSRGE